MNVSFEKINCEHYQEQLELLGDDHKDLKKTISKFRDDELEHHDIGIEHDAESAPGYKIMSKVIELGCKTAIAISSIICPLFFLPFEIETVEIQVQT